jgi:hypothetical protein
VEIGTIGHLIVGLKQPAVYPLADQAADALFALECCSPLEALGEAREAQQLPPAAQTLSHRLRNGSGLTSREHEPWGEL